MRAIPPLHVVISRALDHRLVWMLLEFGADPALMNSEGATALHMAVALYYLEPRYYRDESARALRKRGMRFWTVAWM